jgi:hypothetical protein
MLMAGKPASSDIRSSGMGAFHLFWAAAPNLNPNLLRAQFGLRL